MNKYISGFIFFICLYPMLIDPPISIAVDHGGCLVCHRYPGLVKHVTPDKYSVLHVDEGKHLASPHGKTDCRQCHPKTIQIPHTDVNEVDCTVKCHTEEKEKIDALTPSYRIDYHKNERFAITKLDDQSSCRVCHSLYPHSENNKIRAFINMHTGYMLCEVCHLKKEGLGDISYDWKEPEPFEFIGEPYGAFEKTEAKKNEEAENTISRMLRIFSKGKDKTDQTHKKNYLISRIAVYETENSRKKLLFSTQDSNKAKEYLKKENKLSSQERKTELDFFHRNIARKEISIACNDCHSPEGIMDFEKLGFSENQAKDLRYMNLKSLVTKYDTFVIPNLFGR